jgi:hypothetical protein
MQTDMGMEWEPLKGEIGGKAQPAVAPQSPVPNGTGHGPTTMMPGLPSSPDLRQFPWTTYIVSGSGLGLQTPDATTVPVTPR